MFARRRLHPHRPSGSVAYPALVPCAGPGVACTPFVRPCALGVLLCPGQVHRTAQQPVTGPRTTRSPLRARPAEVPVGHLPGVLPERGLPALQGPVLHHVGVRDPQPYGPSGRSPMCRKVGWPRIEGGNHCGRIGSRCSTMSGADCSLGSRSTKRKLCRFDGKRQRPRSSVLESGCPLRTGARRSRGSTATYRQSVDETDPVVCPAWQLGRVPVVVAPEARWSRPRLQAGGYGLVVRAQ